MPDSGAPGNQVLMEEYIPLFRQVCMLMPHTFDAHEFIVEVIRQNPYAYFDVLHKSDDKVSLANARISNFLADYAQLFNLDYAGQKHESLDIFRNSSECAMFERK